VIFNSFTFFIFLGIVLPVFYFLPGKKSKNLFLLAASYFFYGYWDWRFCSLLLLSTVFDFLMVRAMTSTNDESRRKMLVSLSIISNLSILGIFKYFNFFTESFQDLCMQLGGKVDYFHLSIILPVGISFYTFQSLSYSIDVYRRRVAPTRNFIDFALYLAFFPQLVAGPIERAKELLPQLSKNLYPSRLQVEQGIVLIITGLFKKVIIGDTAGRYVDHIFSQPGIYKSPELLCALILFGVQIYADFSGYSHIARGTAKLLGVELMKNFNQPYFSRSVTEFWRRWHISFSTWLKDYLYIPLGGNRKGKFRTYVNLVLTMLLGGLWHGASWNFVIWGTLHGLYLAIDKYFFGSKKNQPDTIVKFDLRMILQIAGVNILIFATWLFFRSTSWETTKLFFHKMAYWESSEYSMRFAMVTAAYLCFVFIYDLFEYKSGKHTFLLELRSRPAVSGILAALFLVSFVFMFIEDSLPFIYFQF
jgi:alginate O-acetyltransferase complex protein AlgI